jgi:hypothetical protein
LAAGGRLRLRRDGGDAGRGSTDLGRVSFKAALQAIDAVVNRSSPGLTESLAHLLGLIVAFGAAARVGLRRFA